MESPRFSRPQSTASHLFARTRSFHRPTYKRPGETVEIFGPTRISGRKFGITLACSSDFFPILHFKFSNSSRSPISCYVPSPAAQRQTLPVACVQTLDQVSWSRMARGGLVLPRLNWHDWRRMCHARSLGTTQH